MNHVYCISLIVVLVIVIIYLMGGRRQECEWEPMVASRIDKKMYDVLDHFKDKEIAADILARINIDIARLINDMRTRSADPSYSPEARKLREKMVSRVSARYRPDTLKENAPRTAADTSYTENKGDLVAICLREKQSGRESIHDYNTIMFVMLHELAHIGTEKYGHIEEFWKTFRVVLDEAVRSGIYRPVDYSTSPINYCGLQVTYNPLYDTMLFKQSFK